MNLTRRDFILGLLVIAVWALNTVAIKFITNDIPPFTGLTIRLILVSLCFLPFLRPVPRDKLWMLAQISMLICVLHWASLIWSIERLDASMAAILLQMQVIFALLWGWIFFGERFGWRTSIGIGLGIIGVIILVGLPAHPPSLSGVIGIIFSVIALTLGYARMKGLSDIGAGNYIVLTHLIALPPVLAITFLKEDPLNIDWNGVNNITLWGSLAFQVFLVSIAHMVWQRLMNRNAMSVLPNLTLLIPFLGVASAVILLGESITWPMVAGGLLTTLGVAIILIRKTQKQLQGKSIQHDHENAGQPTNYS
jgi:O-acetylserine/cysteine efflux transporter